MKPVKTIITICILLISSYSVSAQDTIVYDLDQAIEYGLQHNTSVINAAGEISYRQMQTKVTASGYLPQITSSADYRYNINLPVSILPGEAFGQPNNTPLEIQMGTKNAVQAGINIIQPLLAPSVLADLNTSGIQVKVAENQLAATRKNTALNIKAAYFKVLLAGENLKLSTAVYKLYLQMAEVTKSRYKNNLITEHDYQRTINKMQNRRMQVRIDSLTKENARHELKIKMNYPDDKTLYIADSSILNLADLQFEQYIKPYDINKIPDYQSVKLQLDLNYAQQARVKKEYLPSLNAYGFVGTQYYDAVFQPFQHDLRWHKQSYVGVRLKLPVFDGLSKSREKESLLISRDKLSRQKQTLENTIDRQAQILKNKIDISLKSAHVQKSDFQIAGSDYQIAIKDYKTGLANLGDVLNAELDMNMKQQSYLNALFQVLQAVIDYENLTATYDK